ncbi:hypothetical protein HAX54_030814 [Datura stramonium]|uniref:HTH CENPB-type domain-containing protein n=1 Tax=Datura stramonium TaxID=4076 RepID=A0ABS8VBM3_DATST|nr:hypothetical protein [Datura stramonium]
MLCRQEVCVGREWVQSILHILDSYRETWKSIVSSKGLLKGSSEARTRGVPISPEGEQALVHWVLKQDADSSIAIEGHASAFDALPPKRQKIDQKKLLASISGEEETI